VQHAVGLTRLTSMFGTLGNLLSRGGNHKMTKAKTMKKSKKPQNKVVKRKPKQGKRVMNTMACCLKSPHSYLDPFVSSGHVATGKAHAPYLMVESVRRWELNVNINYQAMIYLTFTNTSTRGWFVTWTGANDAAGYNIVCTQLDTIRPTHVAQQRLGVEVRNVQNLLAQTGYIYSLVTNDPVSVTYAADNAGDNATRITNASITALANKVSSSVNTRVTTSLQSSRVPVRRICTTTNEDYLWQPYTYVDPLNNLANTSYEPALDSADGNFSQSAVLIYIPTVGAQQIYNVTMRSQDGCRFEPDHAMFHASKHAPILPSDVVAKVHASAHNNSHNGESAPKIATPSEGFMAKVGHFFGDIEGVAENFGRAIPKIGKAIYNTINTGRALNTLRSAVPYVEEVAEAAPLLIG